MIRKSCGNMSAATSGGPRNRRIVWLLIALLAFVGVNATVAGAAFVVAPDGHLIRMPLSQLTRSPFADFRVPGLLLFVFIGLYPIFAAYGLWKGPRWVWLDVLNPFKQCHWSWAASNRRRRRPDCLDHSASAVDHVQRPTRDLSRLGRVDHRCRAAAERSRVLQVKEVIGLRLDTDKSLAMSILLMAVRQY